ncbi:PDZ domain-containing protein [Halomonas sp. PA5]|nr:PDZ domain-containing protein [Halomonas sp. PA5]
MRMKKMALGSAILAWTMLLSTGAMAVCLVPGQWWLGQGEPIAASALMAQLETREVILLGEHHDRMEHHRWQLHTLAGLYARRSEMVIGLEMLPRQAQPALDAWVAGELGEEAFLNQAQWDEAWGYDPALYLPIFHFARQHRIPMVAINIDRQLRSRLAEQGWNAVPEDERYAMTPPATPPAVYRDSLIEMLSRHPMGEHAGYDPERFIAGQLVWDRAMASGLAEMAGQGALVVGLMGEGHLAYGHGVPFQLADLGITDTQVLLPWDVGPGCKPPPEGLADVLFGLVGGGLHEPAQPVRLGILIDPDERGVRVLEVGESSLARQAGLATGDIISRAAGKRLASPAELIALIRQQPPGTLLPLEVVREGNVVELLVRFPVAGDA